MRRSENQTAYRINLDNLGRVSFFVIYFIILLSFDTNLLFGQIKIYEGLSSKVLGRIENQKMYDGLSSKVIARFDGWKVYEGLSSKVLFRVDNKGRVYQGLSSKQILRIDGNKVYQGLSSKVIARFEEGKIYKALSSQVIGRIDGPVDPVELVSVLLIIFQIIEY